MINIYNIYPMSKFTSIHWGFDLICGTFTTYFQELGSNLAHFEDICLDEREI